MSDGAPSATAFAPGHVTGFFVPERRVDPAHAGSRGAGITLTDGVTATVHPLGAGGPDVDPAEPRQAGLPGPVEAVDAVLDAFDQPLAVTFETPLPVGAGFGVSGAAALATAYAANEVVRRRDGPAATRTENELIHLAHVAEVDAGSGLGDVVAQARGGVPIRREPGAPPHGELDGIPAAGRIEYVSLGELSTPEVLAGDTTAIERAGADVLEALLAAPTLDDLFAASRTFAVDAGLLTDDVRTVLEAVETADESNDGRSRAAMAMLGRTVVARGQALSAAGYDPAACAIHRSGAGLVPDDDD